LVRGSFIKGYVTYAPMFHRDRERITDLNYICNNSDVQVVSMLRMKKTAFNQLVLTLSPRKLLRDSISTPASKINWLCSFMFLGITKDSK
jgi:hypothetical protein